MVSAVMRHDYYAVVMDCTLRLGRDEEFPNMVTKKMDKNKLLEVKWANKLIANDDTYETILKRWDSVSGKNVVFE